MARVRRRRCAADRHARQRRRHPGGATRHRLEHLPVERCCRRRRLHPRYLADAAEDASGGDLCLAGADHPPDAVERLDRPAVDRVRARAAPVRGAAAFSEAGSSMFTLGYAPPTNAVTTLIEYLAAFTGVIVVGLQVGYLPTCLLY